MRDFIESIPLAILTMLGLHSIVVVLTTNYIFETHQYIGLALLGISIALFFANRKVYKYVFGITLLVGLVNLIGFTTWILGVSIGSLTIQVILVPIIAGFTWINKEDIKPLLQKYAGRSEAELKAESQAQTAEFKRRFENLANEEIASRLTEKLTPEAIDALKQIQKERESMP